MVHIKQSITVADIFSANFKPMTEADYHGFQGIEGLGSIAEITKNDIAYLLVMDTVAGEGATQIKIEVFPEGHPDNNGVNQVFRLTAEMDCI